MYIVYTRIRRENVEAGARVCARVRVKQIEWTSVKNEKMKEWERERDWGES